MSALGELPDIDLLQQGQVGTRDRIQRLIDRFVELCHSPENEHRRQYWLLEDCARDQWHGTPVPGRFREKGAIPFTIDVQYPVWQSLWPMYDLEEVFTEPKVFLDFQLARKIAQFQWLPEDTYLDNDIFVYLGTVFEPSLFGVSVHYSHDGNPAVVPEPVIKSKSDLVGRPIPDFYQSGLMPVAHRMWEEISELVGERLNVRFVEWLRSPFGVAIDIRGFQNLLLDMLGDPGFFHDILDYVVESQIAWYDDWSKLLGKQPEGISLFNDEIDGNILSIKHYKENIFRHEKALNDAFGLLTYYHSCGDLTPMMSQIERLPRIRMLDLGPYTDKPGALQALGKEFLFEIRVHPERDLLRTSRSKMRRVLQRHVRTCERFGVGAITMRASGMQPIFPNAWDVIVKVREWIDEMRSIAKAEESRGGHQRVFRSGE